MALIDYVMMALVYEIFRYQFDLHFRSQLSRFLLHP